MDGCSEEMEFIVAELRTRQAVADAEVADEEDGGEQAQGQDVEDEDSEAHRR